MIVKAGKGKILKPTAMWLNQCACPKASVIQSEFIVQNFGFLLCLKIVLLKNCRTAFAYSLLKQIIRIKIFIQSF